MNHMIDDTEQDVVDAQYLDSLSEFVATLPKLNDDSIKSYNDKMKFMEGIHTEIRVKHKNFMPVYDPSLDREESPGNKYLDTVYRVSSFEKRVDSH